MEAKIISSKIEVVNYDGPQYDGGGFIYCILSKDIDGQQFVDDLNSKIDAYNNDVVVLGMKESELKDIYGVNLSIDEVTGEEYLNEREPKYPAKTPDGFKSVQVACPEITEERERRKAHNTRLKQKYSFHMEKANENFNVAFAPFKKELLEKWPEFKHFCDSYFSFEKRIYYTFSLGTKRYLEKE